MTVTIHLPADMENALRQHAARGGEEVSAFVLDAVKEKLAKARTLDEVCAPFARAVAETGVSEEEFDGFFEQAREEAWREKQDKAQ